MKNGQEEKTENDGGRAMLERYYDVSQFFTMLNDSLMRRGLAK